MTQTEVAALVREKGIRYFMVSFVEMNGISRAKLVPAETLEDIASDGVGFAGFAAGDLGQGPHDPDIMAIPDFSSLHVLPWQREIAWVASNLYVNGRPWPYCPRTILTKMLKKVNDRGYRLMVGMEPEFFLVRRENGGIVPFDPLDSSAKPCYNQQALSRNLDFVTRLVGIMNELGWGVYQCDHEDANSQFEVNWQYSEALNQSDRLTLAKFLIRSLAEQQGLTATFMPKPFKNLTGNGCHYHMSLWDAEGGTNLLLDRSDSHGLSKHAYWFLGGLLKHARALAAITSPTVNSYKRLVSRPTTSGATWAPVYITYGGNNRTVMIRVPAPGRIEKRTVDGAANPYLAVTAILAAGLDGIENQIEPGPRFDENTYTYTVEELQGRGIKVLPANLNEALDELEADEVLGEALGSDYISLYLQVKRREWDEYHNTVSDWEVERYLTAG
ncbi:glutamine synthetase [Desulfotomaculum arcticum]|uniref:Glutamine synthetase n=1 Tax=Desulfotruncus arcticus DSM 17038 TaxID=1121424 RepID=A0A1I2RJS8_9FIRM|nr:type III glutamate--ammonia ligase [Desulfotruncus arcticus]SFG40808.1 glutamine synthetase [Desulfotomaculum arcticum] [Desulfotruncus arcticus DSM 17038]